MEHTLSAATIHSVAVIGVGRMGGPMAQNLVRAGFAVTAYDTSDTLLEQVAQHGIATADSARAAAEATDVVILMLPSDAAMAEVVSGSQGLAEVLRPGQVLIDMSTSQVPTSQRIAALVASRGAAMLDAPVSGGTQGAQDATLSIMVGGDQAVFERCRPVLAAMGTTLTYVGGNGMGLIAKFVNQMLMEASFCAIAESFAMAAKAGANIDAVYQAVRGGLGGSRVLDQMLPALLSGDLGSGRELTLHHKDGAYALATAESLDAWTPLTVLTHTLFDAAMEAGQGGHSASAVARVFEQRMGVQLVREA